MLTDEDVAELAGRRRDQAAEMLLTGKAGPLRHVVAGQFDPRTAAVSYLVYLAYMRGRAAGILKGRTAYEAWDTLAARVRVTATRAGSLSAYGVDLMRSVGSALSGLKADDLVWWREVSTVFDGEHWRAIRQREALEYAIAGARLLSEWMFQLKNAEVSDEA